MTSRQERWGDYLELVRAPAALTVLGDTLVGNAASGQRLTPRRALLPVASACLYAGGMALNDYADRELDAEERPERPLPSGRITPRRALTVAAALTGTGLALAAAGGGRRALWVAAPLAACVWTYDTLAKDHPTGPLVMGACRGLDVLMGAGVGHLGSAWPGALAMATHTAAVTGVSRGEVHGTSPATAATAVATTTIGTLAVVAGAVRSSARRGAVTAIAAAAYAARALPAQWAAVEQPSADHARTATRQGIRSMVPLQAAWTARAGRPGAAAFLAGVEGVGAMLRARATRQVSET